MYNRSLGQILTELIFLAIASIVLNFLIYSAFTRTFNFPDLKKQLPMYIGGILLVIILHLSFEFTGLNERWCKAIYK